MRTRRSAKLEAALSTSSSVETKGDGSAIGDFISLEKKDENVMDLDTEKVEPPSSPPDISFETNKPNHIVKLASELDPGPQPQLYFTSDPDKMVTALMGSSRCEKRVCSQKQAPKDLLKKSIITSDFERKECAPPISQSRYAVKRMKKMARESSAGSKWFDMRAPHLTPQLKNDLKLLRMRNALDPSRHYKANDSKKLPRYFQKGRVVTGSADFYSSRIPRRQQKQSLVDELLSDESFKSYQHKKYLELQSKSMSGTRRHNHIKFKKKFKKN